MPEHLRHQGLVIWDDSVAKRWAWLEWVEVHRRRPGSPSVESTEEAVRYVIEEIWKTKRR